MTNNTTRTLSKVFAAIASLSILMGTGVTTAHADSYSTNPHFTDVVQEWQKNKETAPETVEVETAPVSYNYTVPYFLQRGQWYSSYQYGNKNIGSTGCGVCTIAMAISAIYGYDVYPSEVASVLYNAGSYNNPSGTMGQARYDAAACYGVACEGVYDYDTFVYDLQQGMIISQMCGPHTLYNVSHGVVVHGYDNGMVEVLDPWGTYTGWYSADKVYGWHSTDPSDLDVGVTVFAFHG